MRRACRTDELRNRTELSEVRWSRKRRRRHNSESKLKFNCVIDVGWRRAMLSPTMLQRSRRVAIERGKKVVIGVISRAQSRLSAFRLIVWTNFLLSRFADDTEIQKKRILIAWPFLFTRWRDSAIAFRSSHVAFKSFRDDINDQRGRCEH